MMVNRGQLRAMRLLPFAAAVAMLAPSVFWFTEQRLHSQWRRDELHGLVS